jgi:hypothetical protein
MGSRVTHHEARMREIAALETAEYYRLAGLFAKKHSESNMRRMDKQREVAINAMREALKK